MSPLELLLQFLDAPQLILLELVNRLLLLPARFSQARDERLARGRLSFTQFPIQGAHDVLGPLGSFAQARRQGLTLAALFVEPRFEPRENPLETIVSALRRPPGRNERRRPEGDQQNPEPHRDFDHPRLLLSIP